MSEPKGGSTEPPEPPLDPPQQYARPEFSFEWSLTPLGCLTDFFLVGFGSEGTTTAPCNSLVSKLYITYDKI